MAINPHSVVVKHLANGVSTTATGDLTCRRETSGDLIGTHNRTLQLIHINFHNVNTSIIMLFGSICSDFCDLYHPNAGV